MDRQSPRRRDHTHLRARSVDDSHRSHSAFICRRRVSREVKSAWETLKNAGSRIFDRESVTETSPPTFSSSRFRAAPSAASLNLWEHLRKFRGHYSSRRFREATDESFWRDDVRIPLFPFPPFSPATGQAAVLSGWRLRRAGSVGVHSWFPSASFRRFGWI